MPNYYSILFFPKNLEENFQANCCIEIYAIDFSAQKIFALIFYS